MNLMSIGKKALSSLFYLFFNKIHLKCFYNTVYLLTAILNNSFTLQRNLTNELVRTTKLLNRKMEYHDYSFSSFIHELKIFKVS